MKTIVACSFLLVVALCGFSQAPRIQWQKVLGNENGDYAHKILSTTDGGYVVAGSREGIITPGLHGTFFSVIKLDQQGNLQWETPAVQYAHAQSSIVQTPDGGYLAATTAWLHDCNGWSNGVD